MEEEYDYLGVDAEEEEMDGLRFFDPSLMSNVAVQLHDKVVRGEHIKGSLPFRDSFTGKDIVVCTLSCEVSCSLQKGESREGAD
jgi:hypothetical protein